VTKARKKVIAKKPRRLRRGKVTLVRGIPVEEGSGNVFADLGLPNPEERLAKSNIAALITDIIKQKGWTQSQAADRLNTHQPTISALHKGTLSSITYDRLVGWLVMLGRPVEIRIGLETRRPVHVEVAIAGR
jgi:predicted XRE-type DNA-binding protein